MRFLTFSFAERLRRHRRVTTTAAVFAFLLLSSWIALPRQTKEAGRTLLCSAKGNLSCDRTLTKGVFDPHRHVVPVDRIVTGALRLASSL